MKHKFATEVNYWIDIPDEIEEIEDDCDRINKMIDYASAHMDEADCDYTTELLD